MHSIVPYKLGSYSLLYVFLLVTPILPDLALAAEVSLAWDASEASIDGYLLFMCAENDAYDYANPAWSGTGTSTEVGDVEDGVHYFVVRAYLGTAESIDSNEIEVIVCDSMVLGGSDDSDVDGSDLANVVNGGETFSLECVASYFGRCP